MIRIAPLTFLALLCAFAPAESQTDAPKVTAYVNGKWWNGETFVPGTRYTQGGFFVSEPTGTPPRTVNLHDAFVVPPYGDAHNHMPGPANQVSDRATRAGVFYLMNPTIMASTAPALRRALQGSGKVDAVLAMGAITSPGGHPEPLYVDVLRPRVYLNVAPDKFLGDAFHYVMKTSDIVPVLDRLQAQGAEFIKIMVLNSEEYAERAGNPAHRGHYGMDPALVAPLVKEAHRRGLRVAAHIETAADFRVIVAAGVDEAAHMPGYYGDVGAPGRYNITDEDAADAARAHIVVVATASLAADSNQGQPERLAEAMAVQRANLEKLKAAGVPLLIGTDGEPDDALKEAQYLVNMGVLTPKEALTTFTETTPQWIFPGRHIGKLAPGQEASFLVLGGDPTLNFDQAANILERVKQGVAFTPKPQAVSMAITHVNVIPMDRPGILKDQTILVSGTRIVAVGHDLKVPDGVQVEEGRGRYALPGLWDMHAHVLAASDLQTSEKMLRTMLAGGITGVRDMGSTMEQLQRFKAARLAGDGPFPELVGAGPVINGPATPWSRPIEAHVANPEEGRRVVDAQIAAGSDFIKAYGGLDPAGYGAVAEETHARGMVLAGHLPLSIDLQTALAAGQRSIEHSEVHVSKSCGSTAPAKAGSEWISAYARNGIAGRDEVELALRSERDPARCRALFQHMAHTQVWWTPTLVLDYADAAFVDDEFLRVAGTGGADTCKSAAQIFEKTPMSLRSQALQGELDDVAAAHRASVKILAGTDMPSPCEVPLASLHRELELFHRAGMSPFEALRTATVEPAHYFGREDTGAIAAGEIANIDLLDQDPLTDLAALRSVTAVVLHGVLVSGK